MVMFKVEKIVKVKEEVFEVEEEEVMVMVEG